MNQSLSAVNIPWSTSKKVLFRFFFLLFMLYIFFNPNGVIPFSEQAYEYYISPFHLLIPWIGKHILHLSYDITVFTNGSGDTTYDYVIILFIVSMAAAGCLIWSVLDRRRTSYNRLYYWLTVIIRYYVALTMVTYGMIKVFKLQFPFPFAGRLLEPYGESSPMGLAWTFFGYSEGYNYFTGSAELLGAVLLLFRRTTVLGALVTLVVSLNIMAVNYFYDIPVKLLSTALVIMCFFLVSKDLRRLYDFFILNRQVAPADTRAPVIRNLFLRTGLVAVKVLLIGYLLISGILDSVDALKKYGDKAPKPQLYGIYNVKTFIRKNDTLAPLTTDSTRWKQMVIDGYRTNSWVSIKSMTDKQQFYTIKIDTAKKTIALQEPGKDDGDKENSKADARFMYTSSGKDDFVMRGNLKGDSLEIFMHKYDINKMLLVSRGFRWINEYPFNR